MLMSHHHKVRLSQSAIFIAAALSAATASAAGYQIAFDSVSGLGRAYAGEAAIGDSASAMGRNPALMALFKQAEVSGALIYFDADISVTGDSQALSSDDTVPNQFVPSTYYVQPIDEKLAFGLGFYSNYGLGTDLKDDFAAGDIGGDTALLSVNLNPSVSYRINPMFSVGAGVSVIYATGEVNRRYGAANPTSPSGKILSWEADDWAFGWNVGALFELDNNNRFGLAYRAGVDLELGGDFTDHTPGLVAIPNGGVADSNSNVPLPATAEFSGFHQLTPLFAVHYSAFWTQWSDYTEFKASGSGCSINGGTCFVKPEKYDDSWRWALGATYQLNPAIKLRAGIALDEKAGATTLSIPDQDALWFSTGVNYQHSSEWSFDLGLAYMDRSNETYTETSLFVGEQTYRAEGHLVILGAQANYRF
ncbi:outer membrane protein transport protein [Enterovibrio sp. 27052020O]|uniref:outer membrane protein transport protein n=1 Tax=Enterovibrio sp. 27052020O TaxID=3241166 RepID=UPI00388F275E